MASKKLVGPFILLKIYFRILSILKKRVFSPGFSAYLSVHDQRGVCVLLYMLIKMTCVRVCVRFPLSVCLSPCVCVCARFVLFALHNYNYAYAMLARI